MSTLELVPVHQRRAHEYVVEELRRAILLRAVGPGERLPSEHDLAELLDVSHITARQALRELEREGLVELRRGRLGGAYVVGVPVLGDGPARLDELRRGARSVRSALEFRRLIEPQAAALAATKANADTIEAVGAARDAVARRVEAPDPAFMAADTAFHLAVAQVSDNPHVHAAVERIQVDIAPALEALPESGPWHARSVTDHADIVSAISDGDHERAHAAMLAHIEATERATLLLLDGLTRRRPRER
jgi:DNA-binding FadR family transcriptional regulator